MDAVAACPDATVGGTGHGEDLDEPVITAAEPGVPTGTDSAAIAALLDPPRRWDHVVLAGEGGSHEPMGEDPDGVQIRGGRSRV